MDYDPKAQVTFADPVVRCDSCQAVLLCESLSRLGCCGKCGNRRIRNIQVLQPAEMAQCREWGVDPKFLALFEEVEELSPRTADPDTALPKEVVGEA